jgi:alpha-beta hydrolase superfamily lysophospholipase
MGKVLGWLIVVIIALGLMAVGGRAFATRAMSQRAVSPRTLGSTTPASVGLPFSRIAVESGDRTLIGWWVRARADSGKTPPAVLFLHGNRSSISDYAALQRFFYRQGISSLVFDYSGFGASGGKPSLENAIADAGRVAQVFADSAGDGARRVAFGSALGATVLLQAIDSVQPHVNGLVIEGVDASVRDAAVRSGRLPEFLAPVVEDIANNVDAAARVRVPLLAVHSYADARVPIEEAQRVVAAVPAQASLVRHWRKGHSALLVSSKPCDWSPVLSFVRAGALPATKLDSTDACAAEAAQLAAAKAAAATAVRPAGASTDSASSSATKSAPTNAGATKTGSKTPASATTTKTKTPTTKAKAPTTKTRTPTTKTKAPTSTRTKAPTSTRTKSPTTRPTRD